MAVKPLESHIVKGEKKTKPCQKTRGGIFLFLRLTPIILPIFSLNCIFFHFPFLQLNACFSVPILLYFVDNMLV